MILQRLLIFLVIIAVGMPVIWAFLKHALKNERISFFGLHPTSKADNPEKFERALRSFRLQMVALPFVALLVAIFMELPN